MLAPVDEYSMTLFGQVTGFLTQGKSRLPYECQGCGERFSLQHHCCPSCDGYSIERVVCQTPTD